MRKREGSYPPHAPAQAARLKEDAPKPTGRPSSLVDTRVIYCGDNLEQLPARLHALQSITMASQGRADARVDFSWSDRAR